MTYGSIKRKVRKSEPGKWKSGGREHRVRIYVSRDAGTRSGAYTATACMGRSEFMAKRKIGRHCGLGTGRTPTAAEVDALRDMIKTMK